MYEYYLICVTVEGNSYINIIIIYFLSDCYAMRNWGNLPHHSGELSNGQPWNNNDIIGNHDNKYNGNNDDDDVVVFDKNRLIISIFHDGLETLETRIAIYYNINIFNIFIF